MASFKYHYGPHYTAYGGLGVGDRAIVTQGGLIGTTAPILHTAVAKCGALSGGDRGGGRWNGAVDSGR